MARFLFVVPPMTGHTNPTLAVAAELTLRGHEALAAFTDVGVLAVEGSNGEGEVLEFGTLGRGRRA